MSKKVLLIQHVSRENPGCVTDVIDDLGLDCRRYDLNKETEDLDLGKFDAMVMLGSPESVYDETEKINIALRLLKRWLISEKPYLGICLGMQMLVRASGGSVVKSPVTEYGFRCNCGDEYKLHVTDEGKTDSILSGIQEGQNIFQLHQDTVHLSPQMKLLATSNHCQNQVVKVGESAYGIQYHPELSTEMFRNWLSDVPALAKKDQELLKQDFEEKFEDHVRAGRRIFGNFFRALSL